MANPQHLTILKEGMEAWNKWRAGQPDLVEAYSEGVITYIANLEGADLTQIDLEGIDLSQVNLEGANLSETNLQGTDLRYANLEGANLYKACLKGANLREANLKETNLGEANLEDADLRGANFGKAILQKAHLERADLRWADLKRADLRWARLEGAKLQLAHLEGTELQYASLDITTSLADIFLGTKEYGLASLADVHWGDADLTSVNWMQVMKKQGDMHEEQLLKGLNEYRLEVRACRQLALGLQAQGLNDEADRFAYRAQVLHRKFLGQQILLPRGESLSVEQRRGGLWQRVKKFASYLFSLFLEILAGYGYKPTRSFAWYLGVNVLCTLAYFILSDTNGFHFICSSHLSHGLQQICSWHLVWNEGLEALGESFAASLTAFHGRGFFPEQFGHGDPRTYIAALEAVLGLFIEASFIATFTARFYRK